MAVVANQRFSKAVKFDAELGAIPDGWRVVAVGDITDVKTGPFGSVLHERDYVSYGTPIVTVEHLGERGLVHENLPMVSDSDRKRLSAYSLQTDDIVFSRVGSVDRNSIVGSSEEGWLFSGRLLRVRITGDNIDPLFLSYSFHQESFKQRVRTVAVGQTMASINTQILRSIKLALPHKKQEQTRVASALSDVDALIASLERLIAKKRAIKQGVMQELLTGKRRLPGFVSTWSEQRIGDVLEYERPDRYIVKSTEYRENGSIPVLTANKSFVLGFTDETFGICRATPAILFDDFTADSKYVDFHFKVKSSAMKILRCKDATANLRFVFERMSMIRFPLGGHKRCYLSEYRYIPLTMPNLDEQNEIARVLSEYQSEIDALEQLINKYLNLKQGMMQSLLTGKIRLTA